MSFDVREVEARLSLGIVAPEGMPPVAWAALEAGYDGPAIRRMAAFEKPTGFEVDGVIDAFLRELGMKKLSPVDASMRICYDKLERFSLLIRMFWTACGTLGDSGLRPDTRES